MSSENSLKQESSSEHDPVYGISHVAETLELHPRTLMWYENMGLVIPARTKHGQRRYSEYDLRRIKFVRFMLKETKTSLNSLRMIFDAVRQLNKFGIPVPTDELRFVSHHLEGENQ